MKSHNTLLMLALAAVAALAACSKNSNHAVSQARIQSPVQATVKPAALVTLSPAASAPVASEVAKAEIKRPSSKLVTFRSRDYGVSFAYPWQYGFVNAKTIAADDSLRPASGNDGQFTLARIEIPAGYYPDTDFDSAYFTLSLNQDVEEQACTATLGKDAAVKTDSINGVDFRWSESESGGHGSAVRQRNYVAFTNGSCYEVEMAVLTRNQDGLAREIDPEQVMRRLDGILRSISIVPEMKDVASDQKPAAPVPQQ